jgi:hypothetical protein
MAVGCRRLAEFFDSLERFTRTKPTWVSTTLIADQNLDYDSVAQRYGRAGVVRLDVPPLLLVVHGAGVVGGVAVCLGFHSTAAARGWHLFDRHGLTRKLYVSAMSDERYEVVWRHVLLCARLFTLLLCC